MAKGSLKANNLLQPEVELRPGGKLYRPIVDTFWQDQTTAALQLPFLNAVGDSSSLSTDGVYNQRDITLTDATGFLATQIIVLISPTAGFMQATVLSKSVNTLTLDTRLNATFPASDSEILNYTDEMAVNGSSTNQIFKIRGTEGQVDVPITIDITRLLAIMETDTVPEITDFGDIATGLTVGCQLRVVNGVTTNIHNVKSNEDIAVRCYDLDTLASFNPTGTNGIWFRMTFAGPAKHGVAIRLGVDESLEYIISDDLTSLLSFKMIAEGHVVD